MIKLYTCTQLCTSHHSSAQPHLHIVFISPLRWVSCLSYIWDTFILFVFNFYSYLILLFYVCFTSDCVISSVWCCIDRWISLGIDKVSYPSTVRAPLKRLSFRLSIFFTSSWHMCSAQPHKVYYLHRPLCLLHSECLKTVFTSHKYCHFVTKSENSHSFSLMNRL